MAVTSHVYPINIVEFFKTDAQKNWEAGGSFDWRACLALESYTPLESHEHRSDVSEPTGENTVDLTLSDPVHEAGSDHIKFDVSDVSLNFSSVAAEECGGVAVYDHNAGEATSTQDLLCVCKFSGGTYTGDAVNDLLVIPGANGIWRLTYTNF